MWFLVRVIAISVGISLINCDTNVKIYIPCHKTDTICLTVSGQLTYQNIIRGVPSLGIVPSDPLHQKEMSGTVNKFVYNFTDVTTTGISGCVVNLVRLDLDLANLKINLLCANVKVTGKYDIHGELFGRKVDESSSFTIWMSSHLLAVDLKLDQIVGADGKKHLVIVDFTAQTTALGPIRTKLENSADLEKFINKHQTESAQWVGQVFVDPNIKIITERTNIFLKSVPIDDLFLKVNLNLDLVG